MPKRDRSITAKLKRRQDGTKEMVGAGRDRSMAARPSACGQGRKSCTKSPATERQSFGRRGSTT